MSSVHAKIRGAQVGDAAEMARLAGELGYPMSSAEMMRRLDLLLTDARHHVAVVADEDQLLGWVHVEHRVSLEGGERAELMGLVVDSTVRRQGWGKALLDAAESWALAQGLSTLTVRSNVARHSSHPFYESFGYTRSKTQHVYAKKLKSSSDAHRA